MLFVLIVAGNLEKNFIVKGYKIVGFALGPIFATTATIIFYYNNGIEEGSHWLVAAFFIVGFWWFISSAIVTVFQKSR